MNSLIEKDSVVRLDCGRNVSFILNDDKNFSPTEYKVLQSRQNSCFVNCVKMLYNGKIQLYYTTNQLKPLSAMLSTLNSESIVTVISNLVSAILDVKQNGFLSCGNIDLSVDKIFVSPSTYMVKLVYLPLAKKLNNDISALEFALRIDLVNIISGIPLLSSPKTMRLCSDLSDVRLGMEELHENIKALCIRNTSSVVKDDTIRTVENKPARLALISKNLPEVFRIDVDKDPFIIGKKREAVDGVIAFNGMISRTHCKIDRYNDEFTVTDLQTTNGTYVNGTKLQPDTACVIKNGDIIRMANIDFEVEID